MSSALLRNTAVFATTSTPTDVVVVAVVAVVVSSLAIVTYRWIGFGVDFSR